MIRLKDRKCSPPGLFQSPPAFGKFISICFDDLCRQIALANHIPNDEALKTAVDCHNAMRLAYGERKTFCDETIPSIKDQGNWVVHEIDSRKLIKGDFHYNASILRYGEKLLFFYRRDYDGNADICVCELDYNYQPIQNTNKKIELPKTNKQLTKHEDPRAFIYQGKIHLFFVKWGGEWRIFPERKAEIVETPHVCLVTLDDNFDVIKEYPLKYGDNKKEDLWEKNWVGLSKKNELYFVYRLNPFTVCKITDNGIEEICKKEWDCPYREELKNSTPPIRVGDKYFTLYHSCENRFNSMAGPSGKRYVVGALAFNENFEITDFSFPFLKASEKDRFLPWTPLVLYPCGAVFENNKWIISMGVHDWYSCIIEMQHSELLKYLKKI